MKSHIFHATFSDCKHATMNWEERGKKETWERITRTMGLTPTNTIIDLKQWESGENCGDSTAIELDLATHV